MRWLIWFGGSLNALKSKSSQRKGLGSGKVRQRMDRVRMGQGKSKGSKGNDFVLGKSKGSEKKDWVQGKSKRLGSRLSLRFIVQNAVVSNDALTHPSLLTFSMLWANSAGDKLMMLFLFYLK